jgi:hypothetical protein
MGGNGGRVEPGGGVTLPPVPPVPPVPLVPLVKVGELTHAPWPI